MKKCGRCGAKNAVRAKFCQACGAEFRETTSAQAETARADANELGAAFLDRIAAAAKACAFIVKPALRAVAAIARDLILRALAPTSTWNPQRPPTTMFLAWALLQGMLVGLPTSLVALVYAALAQDARSALECAVATRRAATARAWLLADLALFCAIKLFKFFF